MQRTAKKCTKIYNARACTAIVLPINVLSGAVLVAVAVVVCLSSLISIFKINISTNFKNLSHTVGISYVTGNFFEPIRIRLQSS